MTKTLTVPPHLVARVRESTYGLLAVAAQAMEQSAHADERPEPVSRVDLEHAWALLGRLGWTSGQDTEEVIELAPEHSTTLHAAAETMVPLLALWLNDLDPDEVSRAP